MYLGNMIYLAIVVVVILTVMHFGWDLLKENVTSDETILWAGGIAIMAVFALYAIIEPIVFYNRYRFMINDERIDVRKGVIIIRRTMVPIERVHQVEVTRGPINNMFGLANVDVTTAGGVATIEYLDLEEAEEIAKRLNAVINKIVKGMKNADE